MDNTVADALSRIENNALLTGQPPDLDFTAMEHTQAVDPQIRCHSIFYPPYILSGG